MNRLTWLFKVDSLPPDTVPLTDDYNGVFSVYGLMIVWSADGSHRADVLDYPDRWKIGETRLPLGTTMDREWHYAKSRVTLNEVIEYARAWGCDPDTAPAGWFRELVPYQPERWGADWAAGHLERWGTHRDERFRISPSCFIPLQLPPDFQQDES